LIFLSIFLAFCGACFLAAGIYWGFMDAHFIKYGEVIPAKIVSIEVTGRGEDLEATVMVEYEADGVRQLDELGFYSSKMSVGQTVQIRHLPEDQNKIVCVGSEFFGFALFSFFGLGGLAFSCLATIKLRKRRHLLMTEVKS